MNQETGANFTAMAEAMLGRIEAALDEAGFDVESPADGILEIEFEDGSKMVVNRHNIAREIWVAARSGGFHFRPSGDQWVDTRSGEDLRDALGRLVAEHSGQAFRIR